jgi:hypothetical protein
MEQINNKKDNKTKLIGTAFIIGGIILVVYGIITIYNAYRCKSWPNVEGKVISSGINQIAHSNRQSGTTSFSYEAIVQYEYSVKGKRYTGKKISYSDYPSGNRKRAERIINRYSQGTNVVVYYDPLVPQTAVLETSVRLSTFAALLGGIVLLGFGLFIVRRK